MRAVDKIGDNSDEKEQFQINSISDDSESEPKNGTNDENNDDDYET